MSERKLRFNYCLTCSIDISILPFAMNREKFDRVFAETNGGKHDEGNQASFEIGNFRAVCRHVSSSIAVAGIFDVVVCYRERSLINAGLHRKNAGLHQNGNGQRGGLVLDMNTSVTVRRGTR